MDSYVVECFKNLPLYNKPIEKPKIKRLKNIDLKFLQAQNHSKAKQTNKTKISK